MSSQKYGFKGNMNIKDNGAFSDSKEENLKIFNKTWIDSNSVDLSENSRLMLVVKEDSTVELKVPLPIFGEATANIVGEVDLYFIFNNVFEPVLKRFEVLEFHGAETKLVGMKKF